MNGRLEMQLGFGIGNMNLMENLWNAQRERAQVWILDGGARLDVEKLKKNIGLWKQISVLHVQGNLQEIG